MLPGVEKGCNATDFSLCAPLSEWFSKFSGDGDRTELLREDTLGEDAGVLNAVVFPPFVVWWLEVLCLPLLETSIILSCVLERVRKRLQLCAGQDADLPCIMSCMSPAYGGFASIASSDTWGDINFP